jgi:ABC-type uncharacterized transport system permease subunit
LLSPLISLGICLAAVLLVLRAAAISAFPLTGLFESMVVLTLVVGLIYLFFGLVIHQVWFHSLMVWIILGMAILATVVASPPSEPQELAATPWAITHGISMILAGVFMTLAAASALLYLAGSRALKNKRLSSVLGRIPNIEYLCRINAFGLKAAFVLLTFGAAAGYGMAAAGAATLEIPVLRWLGDAKTVLILAVWVVLALILLGRHFRVLKHRTVAYVTTVAFLIIIFAIMGTSVFCGTVHDFSSHRAAAGGVQSNR